MRQGRWVPLLLLTVLVALRGTTGELPDKVRDQLKDLPEELLQLVEMFDELPSLPQCVNGIRFTTDGRIVLTTWGDLKQRAGPSPAGQLSWLPCEGLRKEYDVPGVPQHIDRQGRAWFAKAGWGDLAPYVGTDGSSKEVRRAAGRFRDAPYEDREGRVWLTEDAGVHCWDGREWRLFRVLPEELDARDYLVFHRIVSSLDGSLLIFPYMVYLRESREGTSHAIRRPKLEEEPGLVFWHVPRGDLEKATCYPLGECLVYAMAAPLPKGSWLITPAAGTPYPKVQAPFVWRPPERRGTPDQDKLRRLIAALNNNSFDVREQAHTTLEGVATPKRRFIKAAIKTEKRPEVRARLTRILEKWSATSPSGDKWRTQGPLGSYSFLAAEGLWTRDPKHVYLAVWQLREARFAGRQSTYTETPESLWTRTAILRYNAEGRVELLCGELPESHGWGRLEASSRVGHEVLMPLPRGLLVTDGSHAALLEDGRLVDVSAKLMPVKMGRHAKIEVLEQDPAGRIYYRYFGRIRIHAGLRSSIAR